MANGDFDPCVRVATTTFIAIATLVFTNLTILLLVITPIRGPSPSSTSNPRPFLALGRALGKFRAIR